MSPSRDDIAKAVRVALIDDVVDTVSGESRGHPDLLVLGCRTAGYLDPGDAAEKTSFIVADAIIALLPTEGSGWQPIATAPKDRTAIIGANFQQYGGIWPVWWEPEFNAWISGARQMVMAPGYLVDGKASKLHDPTIRKPTHWLAMPPRPAPDEVWADGGTVRGAEPRCPHTSATETIGGPRVCDDCGAMV